MCGEPIPLKEHALCSSGRGAFGGGACSQVDPVCRFCAIFEIMSQCYMNPFMDVRAQGEMQTPRRVSGAGGETRYPVRASQNWFHLLPLSLQIEMLPDGLFQCKRLQCLLLGRNSLTDLSPLVGELSNLTYLELTGNYLETLPPELEGCQSLKRSCLIVEDSLLSTLPPPVTERLQTCLDKC